jgi:hypothetical protein
VNVRPHRNHGQIEHHATTIVTVDGRSRLRARSDAGRGVDRSIWRRPARGDRTTPDRLHDTTTLAKGRRRESGHPPAWAADRERGRSRDVGERAMGRRGRRGYRSP